MRTLIRNLRQQNRLGLYIVMCISILVSLIMEIARIRISGHASYIFLIWNLFLAFIPFVISSIMMLKEAQLKPTIMFWISMMMWLLFFPNSPYIITDFFHLKLRPPVPLWFDTILLMSFIWNGLMLGFISLMDMQHIISQLYSRWFGWVFAIVSIVLGSFGIYLGRFLRWNSWDILSNPFALMRDILDRVTHPFEHERTLAVTGLFSVFLLLGYLMLKGMMETKRHSTTHNLQQPIGKSLRAE